MRLLLLILFLLPYQLGRTAEGLSRISEQLKKAEITEGRFRQEKRIRILKKPLISTGVFTYHQSKGVIWQTQTPVPSLLLISETRLLTQQGEQVLPAAFGKVFAAMLGGDLNGLAEGFQIAASSRHDSWQLQLKPKEEALHKLIASIQLRGDKELRQLDIYEANGNITRIGFDQLSHPATLSAAQEAEFERLSSSP